MRTAKTIITQSFVAIGLGLSALSWLVESFLHSHFFADHYPGFFNAFFFPDAHETWMRLIIIALFISFAIYAQRIIEALRAAEKEVSQAHMELNQIFETSADGMRVVTSDFTMLRVNDTFLRLAGLSRAEVEGRKCYEVFSSQSCHTSRCPMSRITRGEERIEYDELKRRRDGVEVPCIVTVTPFRDGSGQVIGIVEDFKNISERKQAEEELRQAHDQLRAVGAYMEKAREEERRRMAREIHDELGQSLTVLKMDVRWLEKQLPDETGADLCQKLAGMTQLLDHTVRTVQRLSSELRPGLLDDLGLSAAIEWQAQVFRERMGISFDISSSPEDIVVDDAASITIFRIFQEALTNVARHSGANLVTVLLQQAGERLTLTVEDNGQGITEAQLADPGSLGLIGMRERIASLGGTLEIAGRPGRGARVFVSLPLNRGEKPC